MSGFIKEKIRYDQIFETIARWFLVCLVVPISFICDIIGYSIKPKVGYRHNTSTSQDSFMKTVPKLHKMLKNAKKTINMLIGLDGIERY